MGIMPTHEPKLIAMNLKHEINRLSHLFNDGVEKVQTATDEWGDIAKSAANEAAKNARCGLKTGRKSLMSTEEQFLGHVRSNSNLYIFAAAILVAAALARLLMASREFEPQAPLL